MPPPPAAPEPSCDFGSLLLANTRAHCHNLNQVLATELCRRRPDATKLDRLASALERLAELERRLAGRPMPGSLRPSAPATPPPAPRPPAIPSGPSRPATEPPANEQPARLTLTPPPEW